MKYLKKLVDFFKSVKPVPKKDRPIEIKENLYREISESELNNFIDTHKNDFFSLSELDDILKLGKENRIGGIIYKEGDFSRLEFNKDKCTDITGFIFSNPYSLDYRWVFSLKKYEDDWYIFKEKSREINRLGFNECNKYYLCDTFDGVKQLLNKK